MNKQEEKNNLAVTIIEEKIDRCEQFLANFIRSSELTTEQMAARVQISKNTIMKIKHAGGKKNGHNYLAGSFINIAENLGIDVNVIWNNDTIRISDYMKNMKNVPFVKHLTIEKCQELNNLLPYWKYNACDGFDFENIRRSLLENSDLHFSSLVAVIYSMGGKIIMEYYYHDADTKPQQYEI